MRKTWLYKVMLRYKSIERILMKIYAKYARFKEHELIICFNIGKAMLVDIDAILVMHSTKMKKMWFLSMME